MKITHKDERKEFKNGNYCTAFEYPVYDKAINGALIKLTGRYPEKGCAMNEISKELAYVIKGSGKVVIQGNEFAIGEGDVIFIEPNEKFYWEGTMELFMPCAPAWSPDQYKVI
jgi:mannose-6-phosphate isomerase-like protein (cupin superfamily)